MLYLSQRVHVQKSSPLRLILHTCQTARSGSVTCPDGAWCTPSTLVSSACHTAIVTVMGVSLTLSLSASLCLSLCVSHTHTHTHTQPCMARVRRGGNLARNPAANTTQKDHCEPVSGSGGFDTIRVHCHHACHSSTFWIIKPCPPVPKPSSLYCLSHCQHLFACPLCLIISSVTCTHIIENKLSAGVLDTFLLLPNRSHNYAVIII